MRFTRIIRALGVVGACLSVQSARGTDDPGLGDDIATAIRSGDQVEAARLLDLHLVDHPGDGLMHYHAARIKAQLGDLQHADKHLLDAVRGDYQDFSTMKREPDLDPIRARGVYRALMAARDAADDLLAERRIKRWLRQLPSGYHHHAGNMVPLDFISRMTPGQVDALTAQVDTLSARLRLSLFQEFPKHRVTIVVLEERDAARFLPSPRVKGHYSHAGGRVLVVGTGRELVHELLHVLHHAHMDRLGQQHPMWIQEGLATLFEAYEMTDNTLRFLANDRDRFAQRLQADDALVPLQQLLGMSDRTFSEAAHITYPQVRTLFEWINEQGGLDAWYGAYVEHYEVDPTGQWALEHIFDTELASIEQAWGNWLVDREPEYMTPGGSVLVQRRPAPEPESPSGAVGTDERSDRSSEIPEQSPQQLRTRRAARYFADAHPERLNQYTERIELLQRVVHLDATHAAAHYDLGLAYLLSGDLPGARSQHETLVDLDTNLASLLGALLNTGTGRKAG